MLEVKFLNVNQGDSIIIHWSKPDRLGTILLDCNLTINGNETINYIKDNSITEIDYVILSHPHHDHYSGMVELLDYCISNSVNIKYFLYTGSSQPEMIRTISRASPKASSDIYKLFHSIITHYNAKHFDLGIISVGPNSDVKLNDDLTLTFLSPTFFEEQKFIKGIKLNAYVDSDVKNHPAANWLSTAIKIHTSNWYVLLTSDCLKETLIRLDKTTLRDCEKSLRVAQSAHHGAQSSHNNTFWSKRKKLEDTKIVFSVGDNIYRHPNSDVVKYFEENSFKIHSTNNIGTLKQISINKAVKVVMSHIETFSAPSQHPKYSSDYYGHQEFKIDTNGSFV
ncbi:ComEC/Rec2 family competence protein [Mucilaginibacter gilvus]|nr:MBL fold metallo-hydrolase [Mucilaginibacter gilvus]